MSDIKIKFRKKSSLKNRELILKACESRMTVHQITKVVHMERKSVTRYLEALREEKEVYVCGHEMAIRNHNRAFPVPIYARGNRPDVKYKAKSKTEAHREYLKRRKADPDRYMKYLNKLKAGRIKANLQPELAFFFGRAKQDFKKEKALTLPPAAPSFALLLKLERK